MQFNRLLLFMKLLVITQKVDKQASDLGFFHSWLLEFYRQVGQFTVICLQKGENTLPFDIKVLSLGKESGRSKIKYIKNFYKYIWQERKNYDVVFVHMNEEYVLLGGLLWKLLGKPVGLWRNHSKGTFFTRLAVYLSDMVFCTSLESYTSRFKKTKVMPTGINTEKFVLAKEPERLSRSVLSIGRISPVKNIDVFIKALLLLDKEEFNFTANIVGDADEDSEEYYKNLLFMTEPLIKKGKVVFKPAVSNTKTPEVYYSHELFVNMTISGSLDKTIFSAMYCRDLVLMCNTFLKDILPDEFIF